MKEDAFEFAGMSFGPKPDGWVEFKMIQSSGFRRELILSGRNCLDDLFHVRIQMVQLVTSYGSAQGGVRFAVQQALKQFKPVDALDVLRAAQ